MSQNYGNVLYIILYCFQSLIVSKYGETKIDEIIDILLKERVSEICTYHYIKMD